MHCKVRHLASTSRVIEMRSRAIYALAITSRKYGGPTAMPPYPGCYTSFYRQVLKHGLGPNEPAGELGVLAKPDISDRSQRASTASTSSIEYVRNNLRRNLPKLELE